MCIPLGGVSQAKPEVKGARMGGHLQTPVPKLGTRYLHERPGVSARPYDSRRAGP